MSYDNMTVPMWLARVSGFLDDVRSHLISGDVTAANWLQNVSSKMSYDDMNVTQWLARVSGFLDDVRSRLTSGGLTAANWLENVSSKMSYDDMSVAMWLANVSSLVDGLETDSSSVVQRLSQLPGYISDAANSVVGALGNVAITFPDSITATLAPGASISVDADVAGEAAQAGTLWDAIVGDVDTAQIQGQMDATVGVLRTSFPFGCIFVLSDALSALIAAPVAPLFEADLPMIAGSYHVEIDLSFFDGVAALLRGGMVVVYVAGLYSATKHWVFNGGGESA